MQIPISSFLKATFSELVIQKQARCFWWNETFYCQISFKINKVEHARRRCLEPWDISDAGNVYMHTSHFKEKHEKEVNALKMDPVFTRPLSPAAFTVCSSDSSSLKLL